MTCDCGEPLRPSFSFGKGVKPFPECVKCRGRRAQKLGVSGKISKAMNERVNKELKRRKA